MRILVVTDTADTLIRQRWLADLSEHTEAVTMIGLQDRIGDGVEAFSPDVLVLWLDSADQFPFASLANIEKTMPLPIVMLCDDDRLETMVKAAEAGINAYVTVEMGVNGFPSLAAWAIAQFRATRTLKSKLDDQETKLADRIVIERAKGVVMKMKGMAEDTAYHEIRRLAMRRSLPMRAIAEQIIDTADLMMPE